MMKDVLGTQYWDSINVEINKLKQADKVLVSDVMAVLKRSDTLLGRENYVAKPENEKLYVVLKPTKYSIVSGKYLKATSSKESSIILISLTDFVNQLFEFNFAYTQMLFNCGHLFKTDEFTNLINSILIQIKYCKKLHNYAYYKCSATAYGVFQDVLKQKFKDADVLENRLFMIYKLYETMKYLEEQSVYTVFNNTMYANVYSDIVINKTSEGTEMLKDFFGKALNRIEKTSDTDKQNSMVYTAEIQSNTLYNFIGGILCK